MADSAGILLYRRGQAGLEVLLGHPGGPFWKNRDLAAWSMPKGEFDASHEAPLLAAVREFAEETGASVDSQPALSLGTIRKSGRKTLHAFAIPGDFDPDHHCSNCFHMEWPPRSGKLAEFPELDRVAWFDLDEARDRIHRGQLPFLDRLAEAVG